MDPNILKAEPYPLGSGDGDNRGIHEFHSFRPLHFACSNGHLTLVEALLLVGAKTGLKAYRNGGQLYYITAHWSTGLLRLVHRSSGTEYPNILHLNCIYILCV